MARRKVSAATRVARLEERIAEARRARETDQGPVVAYADDDQQSLSAFLAQRGGEVPTLSS